MLPKTTEAKMTAEKRIDSSPRPYRAGRTRPSQLSLEPRLKTTMQLSVQGVV